MCVRMPSIGEAGTATPGVPLAGALIEADPTGSGASHIAAVQATHEPSCRRRARPATRDPKAPAHAGPMPVPLLPGLTAGSPAAQRGQVAAPGS